MSGLQCLGNGVSRFEKKSNCPKKKRFKKRNIVLWMLEYANWNMRGKKEKARMDVCIFHSWFLLQQRWQFLWLGYFQDLVGFIFLIGQGKMVNMARWYFFLIMVFKSEKKGKNWKEIAFFLRLKERKGMFLLLVVWMRIRFFYLLDMLSWRKMAN